VLHGFVTPALYLALAGTVAAWFIYMRKPELADFFASKFGFVHRLLENKYGFDDFNQKVFAGGSLKLADKLWSVGDVKMIDGMMVNGSANKVGVFSALIRTVQSGYLYHYAFAMIIGLLAMLSVFIFTT
jgi:NADH-quinone oxidoreductase subunit L